METFDRRDLSGARFTGCDLSGAVMRGVDIGGAEIESPWLLEPGGPSLMVNGVDVTPFVDAQLDARFPGRAERRADSPAGLSSAWVAVQTAWDAAIARARTMPPGTVDVSIDGEWSFAQTLRHLVMATDTWLRRGIHGIAEPFHPLGQPDGSFAADGGDTSVFVGGTPAFEDVLQARADRVAMVRTFIETTTAVQLAEARPNPHAPQHSETVLSCLHTILEEEWEHLRYATRDLDALEARGAETAP